MQAISVKGDKELYQSFEISTFIAKGNNTVYEVINKKTKEVQCVKEIKLGDRNVENIFEREVKLLEQTRQSPHPHIIQYKGSYIVFDQRNKFHTFKTGFIQMEKGVTSLDNILEERTKNKTYFSEEEVISFITSMLDAHGHLQNISIAHRDIKPENIIVTSLDPLQYKVCDVGVGTAVGDQNTKTRTLMGTLTYLSPQLLQAYKQNKYNMSYNPYRSDVYSLGLVFLYFCSLMKIHYKQRIVQDQSYISRALECIKQRYNNIAGLLQVLKMMLKLDITQRPDFLELETYIDENKLLKNTDLLKTMFKFQLQVSNHDDNFLTIESLSDLKKIQDMANHAVELKSMEIKLDNLKKQPQQMPDILLKVAKIKTFGLINLSIHLTFNELDLTLIKTITQVLENYTSLQNLSLNLYNNKLKTEGGTFLLNSLKNLLNLKSLQINLSCNYIDDNLDCSVLTHLPGLQSLNLDFSVNRLTNQFFNVFLDPLCSLINLKNLIINLQTNRFISSQPLKNVANKLKILKNLETLEINLEGMSVRNQGLHYLAGLVTGLSLKIFNLLMWNCEIKDKAFIEFCKDFSPSGLKKLKLIIWQNDITEKGIAALAEQLVKFKTLQAVTINLSNNPLKDQGIRILNKALLAIEGLTSLKLSLDDTKCTAAGILYIGRALSVLQNLKDVNISLKANKIGMQGFQYIVQGLKHLKRLLKLTLILEQCKITDTGLALLTGKISKLVFLQQIILNLCECDLSESPLGLLATCKGLKHLRRATFDFRRNLISEAINKQIQYENQNIKRFDIKLDALQ